MDSRSPESNPNRAATPHAPPPASAAPRDHLANERTLLAWARTAIATFGLGFIVDKFTAALRGEGSSSPIAQASGIGMVLCGLVIMGLGYVQYRQREEDIEQNRFNRSLAFSTIFTGIMMAVGVMLALGLFYGR